MPRPARNFELKLIIKNCALSPSEMGSEAKSLEDDAFEDFASNTDADDAKSGTEVLVPVKKRKKKKKLICNLTLCKYDVVEEVVKSLGWTVTTHESHWDLFWTDMSVGEERCMRLQRNQKINHFPGMQEVAHKCKLARNLNRLRELLPEHYNFHPESFNLPVDFAAFEKAALGESGKTKSNRTYIIKPDDGACGEGIFLTRRPNSVPPTLKCVAQVKYIHIQLAHFGRSFLALYPGSGVQPHATARSGTYRGRCSWTARSSTCASTCWSRPSRPSAPTSPARSGGPPRGPWRSDFRDLRGPTGCLARGPTGTTCVRRRMRTGLRRERERERETERETERERERERER